jgi:hypothetical protein
MARADTNQGSIGTTNRKPPVLMITKSVKKSTWKLRIPQEEESIWLTQMGINPYDLIPWTEQNPMDSFPFSQMNRVDWQREWPNEEKTVMTLWCYLWVDGLRFEILCNPANDFNHTTFAEQPASSFLSPAFAGWSWERHLDVFLLTLRKIQYWHTIARTVWWLHFRQKLCVIFRRKAREWRE